MEFIGIEKLPSVINDPFLKDAISSINIVYDKKIFEDIFYWEARVHFKNGNTSGRQVTKECETFDEVIIALKQIFNSVK